MDDLISLDINSLDLSQPFNIGIACTRGAFAPTADAPAVIVDRGELEPVMMSFAGLNAQSNQAARVLAQAGVGPGDRVLIWLPNCAEFPIVFFAALKLGAIAVPCSMQLTAVEMQFLAQDSRAVALVTNSDLLQRLDSDSFNSEKLTTVWCVDLEQGLELKENAQRTSSSATLAGVSLRAAMAQQSAEDWPCTTCANDPAYLVYTSGTTGYPKGVLHAHRALLGRLPAASHWFDYSETATDRILHSGKFNWTYVLGTGLMDPLFLGKTVIVYEGEAQASDWPRLIAKHQASIFIGVPTLYRQIIQKTQASAIDVPSLRHCMSAGEHLSDQMLARWQERFGQPIYEAIGMSECSYYLSHHPSQKLKPGSAGRPQPGHWVALLDERMEPVADNQEGMLCIHRRDLGLFKEYWQAPDQTAAAMNGDYFMTGDYAHRDSDGYIWFLGRKDDMVNTFGFRVSPIEVERVLKTHDQVTDCVALQETVALDKHILTVAVIRKQGSELIESELIQFASARLANYKVPKRVVFVTEFPRTANGKVRRTALREQLN